jgi:hypothetical protein
MHVVERDIDNVFDLTAQLTSRGGGLRGGAKEYNAQRQWN